MDHLVYVAAGGATEIMLAQAANSHNLANASTAGFRADLILAQSSYLEGQGVGSRAYASMENNGVDLRQGVTNATGRELDVAVNGEGWIAVAGSDGSEALSRRGDLRVDELGQLLDGAGRSIMGNSGPIALPPFSDIAIAKDGTVSIVPLGEDPNTLAVIDRIKLVKPDVSEVEKGFDGLIRLKETDGEPLKADASVTLTSGSLESSNVNSVSSMVQMIELSRQFEQQVKIMKIAEQLDRASAELMSIS